MQQASSSESLTSAPASVALAKRPRRRNTTGGGPGEALAAYLFLSPYLIVLGVFTIFTVGYGLYLSFFRVDIGFTAPEFIGLRNYQVLWLQLFLNGDFWISMVNIIKVVVVVVTGQTILGLFLAVLLNSITWLKGVFRTIFYLPSVTASIAVAIIFLWLYTPQGGINYLLSLIHIVGPHWLEDPNTALPAIMFLNIWTTAPTFMIFFLAALQDVPKELTEAASVDGADRYRAFWHITLPLLRPTVFLVVALGTIGGFQVFDQIKIMTEGGPLKSTLSPVYVIYSTAFTDNRFGLAAAMSVVLFIFIFVVTLIQRRFIDTGVQY